MSKTMKSPHSDEVAILPGQVSSFKPVSEHRLRIAITALTLILNTAVDADPQPFELRDQNPFNLVHGQSVPTDAALVPATSSRWSSGLIITNTTNIQSAGDPVSESIYLDFESWRINLAYQYGIDDDWNIRVDLPVVYQGGGLFDTSIDNWHKALGLPRGQRPQVEHDQYQIQYTDASSSNIDLSESSTTLGDIQFAAAHTLIGGDTTSMSVWANIKLPTGNEDKLSGSGAVDLSSWLAFNHRFGHSWSLNINAGAVFPGDDEYQGIPVSDYVIYGHTMLGWSLNDSLDLKAQLQGHGSYYRDSQIRILGDGYLLVLGASIKMYRCHHLDLAFSEDIKVDSAPDFSLLINWRRGFAC